MTTGVVLMTYGAPNGDDDLPAYLARVRGGRAPTDDLVAEFRARYARIGGSPLVRITVAQAAALERELGDGFAVAAGMRYSAPTVADAVGSVAARGVERIVGIVMSPQWSDMIMAGYAQALRDAAAALRSDLGVSVAREWHREERFIDCIAAAVTGALRAFGERDVPVLLTAHSLPKRVYDAEPAYIAQLRQTGELVAERAGLSPHRWQWAYQSAGHTAEEWLRPDLKELFPALTAAGHADVLVVPVQFLADHLEVLYDLDVAAADEARAAGLRYHRIAMPNTSPSFIAALAAVVRRELSAV